MTNFDTNQKIVIDDIEIEKVNKCRYLGQTISLSNPNEETADRIISGWRAFGRFKDILCNYSIPMCLRRKVFDQCIIPVITWISNVETYRED